MTTSRRTIVIRGATALVGFLMFSLVAGFVAGYLAATGVTVPGAVAFWILTPVAIALMAGSMWIGALWMRSIDEAAREAHKAAWYWGGTGGMAVGGVLMILSYLPGAEAVKIAAWMPGRADPAAYATTGALALMGLMMIGYVIVWAWWWLARR